MAADPKQVHDIEQAGAVLVQLARVWAGIYRTLIEERVPSDDAVRMVCAFIQRPVDDAPPTS